MFSARAVVGVLPTQIPKVRIEENLASLLRGAGQQPQTNIVERPAGQGLDQQLAGRFRAGTLAWDSPP